MSKAVQKLEPQVQAVAPVNEAAAIFSMIERVASDPSVSVERVEQLFNLHTRIEADRARREFDAAFAEMQPNLPIIERNGTISTNEKDASGHKTGKQVKMAKYARYEDIIEAIRPKISEHGFALSHRIGQPSPDRVIVTCVLSHRAGHREETSFALPLDSTGSKNNVQGWGSSVAYGKRYTTNAILNIATRGEDDDGNAAGGKTPDDPITPEQVSELVEIADRVGADKARFCKFYQINSFADILQSQFQKAKSALEKKGAA